MCNSSHKPTGMYCTNVYVTVLLTDVLIDVHIITTGCRIHVLPFDKKNNPMATVW